MADLTGTTVASNFEKVINVAKTNITNAEMTSIVKELALTYTIAGIDGFLANESADNVRIAVQGTVDYTPDSSNAFGVSGAVSTLIADFDQA